MVMELSKLSFRLHAYAELALVGSIVDCSLIRLLFIFYAVKSECNKMDLMLWKTTTGGTNLELSRADLCSWDYGWLLAQLKYII